MSKSSQRAYRQIRRMILTGEVAPGAHLKEAELSEICGVSRTPVRDALRLLAVEDFVRVVPNHGTFVTEWNKEDMEDLFRLRALLEGYAAAGAAQNATEKDLKDLEDCCHKIQQILTEEHIDSDAYAEENRRFHYTIWAASGSDRVAPMVNRLIETPVLLRTVTIFDRQQFVRSNDQHRELVRAIRSRSSDLAKAIMESHILVAFEVFKAANPVAEDDHALEVKALME